jgi:Lon protease-like protein
MHIFEERYKQLVQRCLQEQMPFGVVLIREGEEVGGPALPESVGTLARIHAIKRLADGRMNILVIGTERFRLLEHYEDRAPYLVGLTEPLHDMPSNPEVLHPLAAEVSALFHEYFEALMAQAGVRLPDYELPPDAEELSFIVAAVLQVELAQRQAFLELTDTVARLSEQKHLLQAELEHLRKMSRLSRMAFQRLDTGKWTSTLSRN